MSTALNASLAIAAFTLAAPALAQFSPGPNPITGTVGAQTLSSGTGTINSGGKISITTNGVALNITGTSTLLNNGTIQTTGTGRAIDSNSGTANLTVTNNGLISSNSSDAFRVNTNSAVSLMNSGVIQVLNGGQAIDWAAITSKSNTLTNLAGGTISAVAEDAIRPGTNGVVFNAGTISATPTNVASPSGSDGIDVRTFTGIQITNTGTITGRHGIATDGSNAGPSTITVNNNAGGVIQAINGSGLNIDGPSASVTANVVNQFGATFRGGVLAAASEADGDGIDVDGVLTLSNSGDVLGLGAKGAGNNAEGIAAGGGTITNTATGRIIGSSLAADAPLGDTTKFGNGILIDNSDGGNAVAVTSITNAGLIEGRSGFGIRIIGTHADTITNQVGGTIRGASGGAAIQTGGGADTLTNRGVIIGTAGSAIDLQGGDDQLKIEGGAASVTGDISGGEGTNTMIVDAGAGNGFAYGGVLSSFSILEVRSGDVTLTGANTFAGTTSLSGGTLRLDGVNRLSMDSSLDLNGGTLQLVNAAANGQTFAGLALSADSTIDLNGSSLTVDLLGALAAGTSLTIVDWVAATSPDYALRLRGDVSSNADFLTLLSHTTINDLAATFRFDGTYTNVAPVPLPAAVWMLLSGVGLLAGVRRKLQPKIGSMQTE